jgi:hypothetical protein
VIVTQSIVSACALLGLAERVAVLGDSELALGVVTDAEHSNAREPRAEWFGLLAVVHAILQRQADVARLAA